MIVSCTNCNSKYSVDDLKVEGKRFGFNCPKCGNNVEIDNREKQRERGIDNSGLTAAMAGAKGALSKEKELELPSKAELSGALENISSKEEGSGFDIGDIELPDLDGLGEISEAGETADDAINISAGKSVRIGDLDFEADEDVGKTKEDLLAIVDSGKGKTRKSEDKIDIPEDFNPIEDDAAGKKTSARNLTIEEESNNLEIEDSDIMNEVKSDEIFSNKAGKEDEDENITIDLDSLDIQLEEGIEGIAEGDMEVEEISEFVKPSKTENLEILDFEGDIEEKNTQIGKQSKKLSENDEDITLDLDALDLTLDEVEELKEGELIDTEDERLSLSDAGLTPDELVMEEEVAAKPGTETEDEDIRISIDQMTPEVNMDKELPGKKAINHIPTDEDELPEIDLDKFEEDNNYAAAETEETGDIHSSRDFKEHEAEIANPDADIRDTVPGGVINFSIDYSLKFSRIGAIFRLLCLFPIILIPHFVVVLIYSVLSSILSFFNWIIIVFTGVHEDNFLEIQENTIRYLLSLSACCIDLVEERPLYAGRKNIDYSLQFDVTYPISYSRILAILRLSVIGIILASLPHLILLLILSIGSTLIYLIGIISIIIRKKWPNILFDFMVRYFRYAANILSFITGVIDRYPSFKFE